MLARFTCKLRISFVILHNYRGIQILQTWGILSKNTHSILYIACTYKFVYPYIISNKNTKNIYYKVFETVFKTLNQMKYVGMI